MIRDILFAAAGAAEAPSSTAGQVVFTASGSWTVPAGVFSISAVAVSPPAAGFGGGLSYINNLAVNPGETLNISLIANASGARLLRGAAVLLRAVPANTNIANAVGDAKYAGGVEGGSFGSGGGAGGYGGPGGAGGADNTDGNPGLGGGGGGGFGGSGTNNAGGGGGVGLLGIGSTGAGGTSAAPGGGGGSGGANGSSARVGGSYGGGGAGVPSASGAIRIMWGAGRSYPSNAADV